MNNIDTRAIPATLEDELRRILTTDRGLRRARRAAQSGARADLPHARRRMRVADLDAALRVVVAACGGPISYHRFTQRNAYYVRSGNNPDHPTRIVAILERMTDGLGLWISLLTENETDALELFEMCTNQRSRRPEGPS